MQGLEEYELYIAMDELLKNSSFKKSVNWASNVLKLRTHPELEAADWIEYIMQFGGCHLRGASMDMSWYELLMLDIVCLTVVLMVIPILVCCWLCKRSCIICHNKYKLE